MYVSAVVKCFANSQLKWERSEHHQVLIRRSLSQPCQPLGFLSLKSLSILYTLGSKPLMHIETRLKLTEIVFMVSETHTKMTALRQRKHVRFLLSAAHSAAYSSLNPTLALSPDFKFVLASIHLVLFAVAAASQFGRCSQIQTFTTFVLTIGPCQTLLTPAHDRLRHACIGHQPQQSSEMLVPFLLLGLQFLFASNLDQRGGAKL